LLGWEGFVESGFKSPFSEQLVNQRGALIQILLGALPSTLDAAALLGMRIGDAPLASPVSVHTSLSLSEFDTHFKILAS
jgi:hypothetical protein